MIEIEEEQPWSSNDDPISQQVQNLKGKIRQYDQWTLEEIALLLRECATMLENTYPHIENLDQWLNIINRLTSAYENKDVVTIADILEYEFGRINL